MRALWISLVLLLAVASAHGAITFGACQTGTNNGTTTVANGTGLSVTTGDLIVGNSGQQTNSTSTYSLSDGVNTYTDVAAGYSPGDSNTETQKLSWAIAASTTSLTITATWNATVGSSTIIVCNFSGIQSSSPEDTSVNAAGSGFITSLNSGTFTTTNANDLLINSVRAGGGYTSPTAGSGFTIPTNGTAGGRHTLEYQIVSAIQTSQTTSLSWTGGNHASSAFAAFKEAATGPVGTRRPIVIM